MKKLIILALLFTFAVQASASTVVINEVVVDGCGVQEVVISGLSAYTGGDITTSIEVDGEVVQVSEDIEWAVVYEATVGTHEVVATVGIESDTSSFTVTECPPPPSANGDPMNSACFAESGSGSCYEKIKTGVVQWIVGGVVGGAVLGGSVGVGGAIIGSTD